MLGPARYALPRRSLVPLLAFFAILSAGTPAIAQDAPPPPAPPQGAPAPEPRAPLMPATPEPAPAAPSAPPQAAPPAAPVTVKIDPAQDAAQLAAQGANRPEDGAVGAKPSDVFAEDWWGRTRPTLELHGYFRVRGELLHNYALGRHNDPQDTQYLWPQPLDNSYIAQTGNANGLRLCGDNGQQYCFDKSQSTANMRLRLNPELHISDNLRILMQVDALDNLVLGSTPEAYAIKPNETGASNGTGYTTAGYNGFAPLGAFTTTQGPPTAGVNGYRNSIDVKRAWAEYVSPIGQLRFGRMPNHWGLGMLANAGDGIDSDYQSTADRIMFATGIKPLDLYFAGMWDFVSSGPTNATPFDVYGGSPVNTANLTNVNQWGAVVVRRANPELQKLQLARGDLVINGGVFTIYRSQYLDVKGGQTPLTTVYDANSADRGMERRSGWAIIPDFWLQVLYRKFRFEAEFATIQGQLGSVLAGAGGTTGPQDPVPIQQYGLTTQAQYKAFEDKLRIDFGFGWASGDAWVEGLSPGSSGLQPQLKPGTGPSTFRFHPDYRVDLIFWRRIMTRVSGAYYFRPSVEYDFIRNPNGQKLGGGATIIWSRASEFIQTPGNKRDLGVELDFKVYYQAKDGKLNDDPTKLGGFYASLEYGVFFPLGGLAYPAPVTQATDLARSIPVDPVSGQPVQASSWETGWDLSAAQTVRLFLGVAF
jgi:uncharacterized protein (TIGR04551 family)